MAARKTTTVMIVNRRSKMALQSTGLENGLVVEQAAVSGSDAQLWRIVEKKNGVKLVNKASGKVLDVMVEGTENGTLAQTWENVRNGESQLWQVVSATATYKKLLNVRAGKVLDIEGMSDEEGAPAQIWEDVDGEGQQWKLVAPKKPAAKKPAKKQAAKKSAAKKAAPAKKAPTKKAAPAAQETAKAVPAEKPVAKAASVTKEVKKPAAKKAPAKKAPAKKAAPAKKPAQAVKDTAGKKEEKPAEKK